MDKQKAAFHSAPNSAVPVASNRYLGYDGQEVGLVRPRTDVQAFGNHGPSGEQTMRTLPTKLCGIMAALAVLAYGTAARSQVEQRPADLRQQALKLNEITGTEARRGEQEKLLK